MTPSRSLLPALSCVTLLATTGVFAAPSIGGCPVFPSNSAWNARVDTLPVHPSSATWISTIGATKSFHMDFGSFVGYGIPFVTVPGTQPKVPVTFVDYGDESDADPGHPATENPLGSGIYVAQYPIPSNAPIEGEEPGVTPPDADGDRHVLVIDTTHCILYETGNNYRPGALSNPVNTTWQASGGATWDLASNAMRPLGWTSADAAGLSIFAGLARYEEANAGLIEHALRVTVPVTQKSYVWPASHQAGSNNTSAPPMGARFRLKASYNINGFSPRARAIAQAMKTYGIIVADNGSSWYVTGASNPAWNDTELHQLDVLKGSDFEAVDTCGMQHYPNSYEAAASADVDNDGIPNCVEANEGRNVDVKDNDVFGNPRLFVMQQYRDFLGREGDASGIQFWTGQVGPMTRGQVIESFFNSAEFQGTISPVARLYFAYFRRIPDYAGLTFWIGFYRAGNPLAVISDAFAQSAEFTATYGALTNSQFVDLVYNNVLGRAADAGGKAFWQGQLDGGTMSRGQVMLGFSESDEYKAGIASEVYVTMMYIGMLRRAPDQGGFDFWVQYKDAGNPGLALINGFLGSPEYHNRFLP
jgi:hypothetical protein